MKLAKTTLQRCLQLGGTNDASGAYTLISTWGPGVHSAAFQTGQRTKEQANGRLSEGPGDEGSHYAADFHPIHPSMPSSRRVPSYDDGAKMRHVTVARLTTLTNDAGSCTGRESHTYPLVKAIRCDGMRGCKEMIVHRG